MTEPTVPTVTKADALAAYGGNASALARALDITPQAIYQWDDGPIADVHAMKLLFVLRPSALVRPAKGRPN